MQKAAEGVKNIAEKAKESVKNIGDGVKQAVSRRRVVPNIPPLQQSPMPARPRVIPDRPTLNQIAPRSRPRVIPNNPYNIQKVTQPRPRVVPTTSRVPQAAPSRLNPRPAVSSTLAKPFAKLSPIKQQRVVQQAIKDVNRVISSLDVKTLFGKTKLNQNQGKSDAELRSILFEGVDANLEPAKERCEKKFGKGRCMKLGDYAFVYLCSGNQVPEWIDTTMKRFKCSLPKKQDDLEDSNASTSSSADLLGLDEVYEAFYYEVLDA